jgi:pyruvate/2-oxoglutarate dehydrogenase complex dihydrolipoamide acyltransferase (E2) component
MKNTDIVPVKMNRMRLKIAERLKQSQNTAAFLTTFRNYGVQEEIQRGNSRDARG